MRQAVTTLAINAERKGLRVGFDVGSDVPERLIGDPLRLRQVLLNLINNAIKFTGSGSIELNSSLYDRGEGNVTVHFSVRDTGVGIPADKVDLIFEAFRQADGSTARKFGGTGLGLTISTRIVAMMQGHLWVNSQGGRREHLSLYCCVWNERRTRARPALGSLRTTLKRPGRASLPSRKLRSRVMGSIR